jgi:hypothetical protein
MLRSAAECGNQWLADYGGRIRTHVRISSHVCQSVMHAHGVRDRL